MTAPIPATAAWREQLSALRFLAAKVARVHGPTHPDAAIIAEVVNALTDTPAVDLDTQAALGRRLDELTGGFHPWPGSCGSVHQLFAGLKSVAAAMSQKGES